MTMLIEQETSKSAPRVGARAEKASQRLSFWTRADVFADADVSPARQVAAWLALAVCLGILVFLLASL